MKEISINPNEKGGIDLVIDGQQTTSFENCIEAYSFWEDMEAAANKAMFRIKRDNPKMNFNFDLNSMMVTPEQRREGLIKHVNKTYPAVNAQLLFSLIDTEVEKVKPTGPPEHMDEHPNPFFKVKLDSDIIKAIMSCVIEKYESQNVKPNETSN